LSAEVFGVSLVDFSLVLKFLGARLLVFGFLGSQACLASLESLLSRSAGRWSYFERSSFLWPWFLPWECWRIFYQSSR